MKSAKLRRRHVRLYVLLALVSGALILWNVFPSTGLVSNQAVLQQSTALSGQALTHSVGNDSRQGSLNGLPFSIPESYLEYPIEYLDSSSWLLDDHTINPNKRTHDDAIQEFTLRVHWPDLGPFVGSSSRDHTADRHALVRSNWLSISVNYGYVNAPRPPEVPDNGMARLLRGRLERLSSEWQSKHPLYVLDPATGKNVLLTGVHYEMRGLDRQTGLQSAVPVGPGTETFHIWNNALYWQGDENGIVETLITCYHGALSISSQESAIGRCEQKFDIPEIKAEVTLHYSVNWLPHWKQFRDRSKFLVLSFQCSKGHAS